MGALALEFHIIIEVQGSKRQMHQGYFSSSLRTGSKVCHWAMGTKVEHFAIIKKYGPFPPLYSFPLGEPSSHSEFCIVIRIINSYYEW